MFIYPYFVVPGKNIIHPIEAMPGINHFSIDEADIIEFAEKQNIHPAIVKGRLCFEQPVYYRKRYSIPNEIN